MSGVDITVEPGAKEVPATQAEVLAADVAAAEAVTAQAEASTEIAAIEAERSVAVEEIRAETERHAIDAAAEAEEQDDNEWRLSIEARLATQDQRQEQILSTLTNLAERLPPSPQENSESPEAMPGSQEAPEPPPRKPAPHHRLI